MYSNIPNQRVPLSQKTKKWREESVQAYMGLADTGRVNRKDALQKLYDYYNGVVDDEDYRYVLKPYGKERKNFPSKLRNYPLIKPTIDLLLGEKSKRPFNYSVVCVNEDVNDRRLQQKNEQVLENMKQNFVNELNRMGVDTGVESEEVPLPKDLAEMFDRTYRDNRAVIGQRALDYIVRDEEVVDKFVKGWFHFLVAGEVFTQKMVSNNSTKYHILNPLHVDYDLDPDLEYVEDGDWALVTKFMHPSTIVETWGRDIKDLAMIDQIMALSGAGNYGYTNYTNVEDVREAVRDRLVMVRQLYWQSMKRIGFVTYFDELTGEEEMFEVEDGYKLSLELKTQGAKLEWEWHNEVWEAVVVDDNIYIKIEPYEDQREGINNPSKNKLPINGRRYSDINSANVSLVMLGIPYQLNKNVVKYRLETSLARSKDIIAQLDINLIPKKWDMDKFMYYVEGTGIAWVDYNKEGVNLNPNHQSVMDLSIKTISMYVELLQYIEDEWERVSGVNRQRRGEISQYEGKATGQQAIVQSSHTTEDMYRKFAGLEQRDLQGLVDISKRAWVEGKNTMYLMPDGTQEFLSIDPDPWLNSELGVFVSDATRDVEKMNLTRELAQSLAQNGAKTSMILDILNGENFTIMKGKIEEAEKAASELAQAQAQAEAEAANAAQQQELRIHEDQMLDKERQRLHDSEENEKDRQNKITLAEIAARQNAVKAEPMIELKEEDNGPTPHEISIKNRETAVKEKAQQETVRHNKAQEGIARSKPSPSSGSSKK